MPGFRLVRIQRFKNIIDATFDLGNINVFVGANNSGKSSILQALHFAVGAIQSLKLDGRLSGQGIVTSTVDPAKLIYVPSEDVHALGSGGRLWEPRDRAVQISLTLDTGERLTVSMRKGRNRNIQISVSDVEAARGLAIIERPYTIFTPGLAGVAKAENWVSDGVLLRAIARGDSNLVLRNTLLRLWNSRNEDDRWGNFTNDLAELFPDHLVTVAFESPTDEYIRVSVNSGGGDIPLELCGTGVLQAIQILSYIHGFSPSVIVLDEPDSHLHPNNQRILCSMLRTVAETRNIQVVLCTHSRHMLDALQGGANFLWARNGTVDIAVDGTDLAILLDLGALDVKERIAAGLRVCVVLTEDKKTKALKTVCQASGFDINKTEFLSYNGCTSPHNLRPLLNMIKSVNQGVTIVVHQDRDYHTDEEISEWEVKIRDLGAEPFVTTGVDIESHFLSAEHLSALNAQLTVEAAEDLIERARQNTCDESITKFINSRCDIEKKNGTFGALDVGALGVRAPRDYDAEPERYCHSKKVMASARSLYREENGLNLISHAQTQFLSNDTLAEIYQRNLRRRRRLVSR